jgi:hypothetical protein
MGSGIAHFWDREKGESKQSVGVERLFASNASSPLLIVLAYLRVAPVGAKIASRKRRARSLMDQMDKLVGNDESTALMEAAV